jgi:tetratricopeptide (TPR) repeat protein
VSIPIRLLRGPVRPRAPEPRAPGGATQQVAIPGTASLGNEWMTGGALRDAEEELTDGAPTKAAELFEKIIVADPRNLDARWGLVRAYRAQGRTKEALALGERLIADLASAGRNEDARRVYALLMS